jgi:hypothetical protein
VGERLRADVRGPEHQLHVGSRCEELRRSKLPQDRAVGDPLRPDHPQLPYGRGPYNRSDTAVWTLKNFKAGRFFRVNITLPFKQHNDPKGSNLEVEARGYGPWEHRNVTKDVIFKKSR